MMEITLQLSDGKKKTFSEEELVAIVEELQQIKKFRKKNETTEFVQGPEEGKWFKVYPLAIDQNIFKEERADSKQEEIRQYILKAFERMKENPKYSRPFKTKMPMKIWEEKSMRDLIKLTERLGDHMTDIVEQSLEWAQRIYNGETWEDICNKPDTANWYRLVDKGGGILLLVGGSRNISKEYSASSISAEFWFISSTIKNAVPSVLSYKV